MDLPLSPEIVLTDADGSVAKRNLAMQRRYVCLNGRHVHVMQRWDDNNKIRKIVIDEPHSIYTEPYRAAFDELQRLKMYRTPKLFIDATMPVGILSNFLRAVGINSDAGIVGGIDYPVPNVEISVKEATNASNDDTFVKEILDSLEEMLGG